VTAAWATIDSPLGELVLEGEERGVTALRLPNLRLPELDPALRDPAVLAGALSQLAEYFAGSRRDFDLPLAPAGGDFDLRVWRETSAIPYGETASYGEIARAVGRPDGAREVGGAMARNPIPVIVPCHRVVGSDGALVGYAGGLERKRLLLDLEAGRLQESLW
jgi:methylated-DNA-[protein]-cysteine S-methyltransferase